MSVETNNLKWFTYTQMLVGKRYKINDKIAHYVLIQANNFSDANNIAERIGIYFEGSDDNRDCRCCGDRWFRNFESGDSVPKINGDTVDINNNTVTLTDGKEFRVHPFGSI